MDLGDVLRVTSVVSSLLLILVAITSVISFGVRGFILHFYIIGFSLLGLIVELKFGPEKDVIAQFPFIETDFGRACVYLFTSSMVLVFAYVDIFHTLVGFFSLANACVLLNVAFTKPEALDGGQKDGVKPGGLAAQDKTPKPVDDGPPAV